MMGEFKSDILELVNNFDVKHEPLLNFDDNLKERLDDLIKKETGWNKIAVACRRMIICDRELDLEMSIKLIDNTIETFEGLENSYKNQHYEAIRYCNTYALIMFRKGDYYNAKKYFCKAKEFAADSDNMKCFIPDTTSNIIRSKFDLFRYTLPQQEIRAEEKEYYKIYFENFIKMFEDALDKSVKYQTNDEKLRLFFAHGKASLFHNLGDVYGAAQKSEVKVFDSELADLIGKAIENHIKSLEWGVKANDIYRQLQSKNQLCSYDKNQLGSYDIDEIKIKEFEEDLLNGKWIRGRQFVLQRIIKRLKKLEDINSTIKGKVKINNNEIEVKGGLILDENYDDKIVVLHNYEAIKTCIKKGIYNIQNKNGNPFTLLNIADAKIKIANKLRDDFSYLLYRRQAINLIREDVLYKIEKLWENEKEIEECINFSEDYNCRGLIELAQLIQEKKLKEEFFKRIDKIEELKKPIFNQFLKQIEKNKSDICHLALKLNIENDNNLVTLLQAYENLLDEPFKSVIPQENNLTKLINKLEKIPPEQNTAVIRFWVIKGKEDKEDQIRAVLITRDGIKIIWKGQDICFNLARLSEDINKYTKRLEEYDEVQNGSTEAKQDAYNGLFKEMSDFSEKLKLYDELIKIKNPSIKNLFIIPDGKLFQLPLHLLGKNGQDLRKDNRINIYYCPTLYHLLKPIENSDEISEESKYLWLFCPTPDLYSRTNGEIKPVLSKLDIFERNKNNIILEYDKATYNLLLNTIKTNKLTHIGFSTHGEFHDNSKEAYISPILLSDSFLTPYDVLFLFNLKGVQTIFMGACQVGSSKYTDENEAVGLVTSFLTKNAISVIASLWSIHYNTHNFFIETLNKSNIIKSPDSWDLSEILYECKEPYRLTAYVQYANIAVIERRINQ